jgi:anaerobic magnesium-protoporphyrin IX monomethyl ester cyclase
LAAKFSISISFPPLNPSKGTPFLSQNRQFQWSNNPNVFYPVILASAATLLKSKGYQVFWDDAIAQKISFDQWLGNIIQHKPNIIAIETKTPVVKQHWQIINQLKKISQKIKGWNPKIVLMGDHVTALPQESLTNSLVDYILTGGDYDFMLLSLADHLHRHTKLDPGFWFSSSKGLQNTGQFSLIHHHLDRLPIIDRDLTQWQLYAYNNNNYRYLPGAYIMSGRDCWWGKCTFCSWTTLFPGNQYRHFSAKRTLKEIKMLVNKYHVKEIFDDSGTIPTGSWLEELCHGLIDSGLNRRLKISCNLRFGALNQQQYHLLAKAGFRFLLYGFESGNQTTLDRINKNNLVTSAKKDLIMAKKAGLHPHLTVMIGYPWETNSDALRTLSEAKNLFRQGLVDSMQATIVIPYPGTPLFDYCQRNNLLVTKDWDKYDMRQPVIKSPISSRRQKLLVQNLFKGIITPKFMLNQILSIRSVPDFTHLLKYTFTFFKKLRDFS